MRRRRNATVTRRSSNGFFKSHWKAIAIAIVAIIMIALIAAIRPFSSLSNLFNDKQIAGEVGIVTVNGNKIGVFNTREEAEANKTSVEAGVITLEIYGSSKQINVSAHNGVVPVAINNITGNKQELDLTNSASGSIIDVKVMIGGDGSWVGQRLGEEVDTYYLALEVVNHDLIEMVSADGASTQQKQSSNLLLPNGKVYFGEDSYQTYASESDAQQAVAIQPITIPTFMVRDGLQLRAEPNANTARIWVSVCMVDDQFVQSVSTRLNQDSNWTGTLDISEFAGHQVTLVMKAENNSALMNGYSYVSFKVPEFSSQLTETEIQPVVVY